MLRRSCLFIGSLLLLHHTTDAQVGFGPELGAGISSMHFAPPLIYTTASVSPQFSMRVGGIADAPIHKHIYVQGGVLFSIKGAQRSFSYYANDSFNENVQQTLNLMYIEVPAGVVYKTGMQGRGRVIGGIGAVPAYLIGGKNKLNDHRVYNDTLSAVNGTFGISANNPLKAFDIGLHLFLGYELGTGFQFKVYFISGVNDLGLGTEIDKNRVWGVSCAYLFGKGRNINKELDDLIDHSDDK